MNIFQLSIGLILSFSPQLQASPPTSAIKARLAGVAEGTMSGNVVFSSSKNYRRFEVYLNTGDGSPAKVCQQLSPVPEKEYQCSFSATAATSVNAMNLYVVGIVDESGSPPDQETLAVLNPKFSSARTGVSVSSSPRLQLAPTK